MIIKNLKNFKIFHYLQFSIVCGEKDPHDPLMEQSNESERLHINFVFLFIVNYIAFI